MITINERIKIILARYNTNLSDRSLYSSLETIYKSDISRDYVFLWVCDDGQSLFFKEKNLFIIGSSEYENLALYGSVDEEDIPGYLIKVDFIDGKSIYGDIRHVNLRDYFKHVSNLAIPLNSHSLLYERDVLCNCSESLGDSNGLFLYFEPEVLNELELERILQEEHLNWENCRHVGLYKPVDDGLHVNESMMVYR